MLIKRFSFIWLCVAILVAMQGRNSTTSSPLQTSQQLLVVCTEGWDQMQGKLQRFERKHLKSAWKPVGKVIKVCVGKNGLGWGVGLHPHVAIAPQKREGDSKAPAGIFKLSAVFSKNPKNTYKLPFIFVDEHTEAVDDVKSTYYTKIVNTNDEEVIKDWDSSEKMHEIDLYNLGAVVDHNMPVKNKEAGSCIFLHEWRGEDSPTAGFTAMDAQDLKVTCEWLDSAKKPLLVQLPTEVYKQCMKDWQLPKKGASLRH